MINIGRLVEIADKPWNGSLEEQNQLRDLRWNRKVCVILSEAGNIAEKYKNLKDFLNALSREFPSFMALEGEIARYNSGISLNGCVEKIPVCLEFREIYISLNDKKVKVAEVNYKGVDY